MWKWCHDNEINLSNYNSKNTVKDTANDTVKKYCERVYLSDDQKYRKS